MEDDRLHTINTTLERIPVSRDKLYQLIGSGQLKSIKIGRRRFVAESAIQEFIADLQTYPAG